MLLVKLFLAFFRIGLFAIGGAYSFLPLLEKELVQKYHWMTKEEFLDILGMIKILPGAISIKYATYTGYKMAGVGGAIAANLGNILAPVILIAVASTFYSRYKGLANVKAAFGMVQLAVFAMIIAVAFQLIDVNQVMQLRSIFVVAISFLLFVYTKIHPAIIIITAGLIGAFLR